MNRILIILILFAAPLFGQQHFRIEGTFSTKQKTKGAENASLLVGKFYYDLHQDELLYDLSFPDKYHWLFRDTSLFIIQNRKIQEERQSPINKDFNLFKLLLSGDLVYYGLKDSPYSVDEVRNENGMVITIWAPPYLLRKKLGKVAISTKDKKLHGVIFYRPDGSILRKQFFDKYELVRGLNIPTRVIDIYYMDDKEIIQETNYSKLTINERGNLHMYRYTLPKS